MKITTRPRRVRVALAALAVPGAAFWLASGATAAEPPPAVTGPEVVMPPQEPLPVRNLRISKTAEIHYTRENHWSVDKSVSSKAGYDAKNKSVAANYTVAVTKDWTAKDVIVRGTITIKNPNPFTVPAIVTDVLPGGDCRILDDDNDPRVARMAGPPPVEDLTLPELKEYLQGLPDGAIVIKGELAPGEEATGRYVCELDYTPKKGVENTASIIWPKFVRDVEPNPEIVQEFDTENTEIADNAPETLRRHRALFRMRSASAYAKMGEASYDETDPYVKVTDTMQYGWTRVLHPKLGTSKTFTYTRYLDAYIGKCRVWDNQARVWGMPEVPDLEVAQLVQLPDNGYVEEGPRAQLLAKDEASIRICPPPPPTKGEPAQPPVVTVENGGKTEPADVTPSKNPKGPIITPKEDPVGSITVHKRVVGRRAVDNGMIVKWKIIVRNTGKSDLSRVRVVDLLPKQLGVVTNEKTRRANKVLLWSGDLGVGQRKVFTLYTRALGRPTMDRRARALVKRMTAKQRRREIARIRRGGICNQVLALAENARPDRGQACIRVMKPRPEEPQNGDTVTEASPGNAST